MNLRRETRSRPLKRLKHPQPMMLQGIERTDGPRRSFWPVRVGQTGSWIQSPSQHCCSRDSHVAASVSSHHQKNSMDDLALWLSSSSVAIPNRSDLVGGLICCLQDHGIAGIALQILVCALCASDRTKTSSRPYLDLAAANMTTILSSRQRNCPRGESRLSAVCEQSASKQVLRATSMTCGTVWF